MPSERPRRHWAWPGCLVRRALPRYATAQVESFRLHGAAPPLPQALLPSGAPCSGRAGQGRQIPLYKFMTHTPLPACSRLALDWPLAGNWLATGEGLEPSPRVRISSPSSRWDFVMPLGHRRLSLHSLTLPRHCLPTHDTGHAYPTRAARRPHADSTTRPPPGVRAPTRSEVLCFKP